MSKFTKILCAVVMTILLIEVVIICITAAIWSAQCWPLSVLFVSFGLAVVAIGICAIQIVVS